MFKRRPSELYSVRRVSNIGGATWLYVSKLVYASHDGHSYVSMLSVHTVNSCANMDSPAGGQVRFCAKME